MRAFRVWALSRKRSPNRIVDVTKDENTALVLEGKGWLVTPGRFVPDKPAVQSKGKR